MTEINKEQAMILAGGIILLMAVGSYTGMIFMGKGDFVTLQSEIKPTDSYEIKVNGKPVIDETWIWYGRIKTFEGTVPIPNATIRLCSSELDGSLIACDTPRMYWSKGKTEWGHSYDYDEYIGFVSRKDFLFWIEINNQTTSRAIKVELLY